MWCWAKVDPDMCDRKLHVREHAWSTCAEPWDITTAGCEIHSAKTRWHMNTTTCRNQTGQKQHAEVVDWGQVTEGRPQLSCLICHMVSKKSPAHVNDYATLSDVGGAIWWRGATRPQSFSQCMMADWWEKADGFIMVFSFLWAIGAGGNYDNEFPVFEGKN